MIGAAIIEPPFAGDIVLPAAQLSAWMAKAEANEANASGLPRPVSVSPA